MENVPARTLTINPAGDWLTAAGAFMGRVRLAVRAFGEALHKEPVRSRAKARRQDAEQQPVPRPSPWKEPGELPETYGLTRVVAMVVSPYLVHVYWDLSAKDRAQSDPACLRFHDTTAGGSFDVNVDLAARNWYIHLWSPEKRYLVELGLQRAGSFQPLARSNPIETPRAWPVAAVPQISEPLVPPPQVPPGQTFEPSVQAASIPASAAVAAPAPAAQKDMTPESAVPAPAPRPPQAPGNAVETLRRRLSELYGFYRWPRPMPPPPESATPDEFLLPPLPKTVGPEARTDFIDRLEAQFSPGLSSGQLQDPKPRG